MKKIAESLWIFEGPDVRFLGLDIPTRMTIARRESSLWVHSPVPITPEISQFLANYGDVGHVVAPNNLHHLYLDGWQREYPNACYVAAPGLREKRPDLRFDDDLLRDRVYSWTQDIAHEHFLGNRVFEEVVFFHRESKTLILTDLILNLKTDGFNWVQKKFAKFDGIAFPDGGSPRLFRWNMRDRKLARSCYQQMLDWAPDHVIISHGESFFENGLEEVKRRFSWVVS